MHCHILLLQYLWHCYTYNSFVNIVHAANMRVCKFWQEILNRHLVQQSTHIPFTLSFLRYSFLKIKPWKSKVKDEGGVKSSKSHSGSKFLLTQNPFHSMSTDWPRENLLSFETLFSPCPSAIWDCQENIPILQYFWYFAKETCPP